MAPTQILLLAAVLGGRAVADTVFGAYLFVRHGDRTPKILAPTNLTDLGYREVYFTGDYYRSRYLDTGSPNFIKSISTDLFNQEQLLVSAPADTVLQNSATGFLQGLYPPVGSPLDAQKLRNGTTLPAPMDGYQLIPVSIVESGGGSENSGWLQDSSECLNAESSSNNYYLSREYMALYDKTKGFYSNLEPVISSVFPKSDATYYNAYEIFDYLNVAWIHNQTIPDDNLLTSEVRRQLLTLANAHEFGLAYNSSSKIRAVAGMQLAGEIVQFFQDTISGGRAGENSNKLGVQFGAYGTFQSFFGLADLPQAAPDFYGIPDYASSMAFELFVEDDNAAFPASDDDLMVRFLFHNGSTSTSNEPHMYPLFGQDKMSLTWTEFAKGMGKFSISTTEEWCVACGNTTGICAPYASDVSGGSGSSSSHSPSCPSSGGGSGSGLSNAVAGVIGAFVTLAVMILVEFAILFGFGLTLVSKKRLQQGEAEKNPGWTQARSAREAYHS